MMSQAVYIQQLQEQVQDMPKIKKAVQIQEKTIKRLENMLEMQVSTSQSLRKTLNKRCSSMCETPLFDAVSCTDPALTITELPIIGVP